MRHFFNLKRLFLQKSSSLAPSQLKHKPSFPERFIGSSF